MTPRFAASLLSATLVATGLATPTQGAAEEVQEAPPAMVFAANDGIYNGPISAQFDALWPQPVGARAVVAPAGDEVAIAQAAVHAAATGGSPMVVNPALNAYALWSQLYHAGAREIVLIAGTDDFSASVRNDLRTQFPSYEEFISDSPFERSLGAVGSSDASVVMTGVDSAQAHRAAAYAAATSSALIWVSGSESEEEVETFLSRSHLDTVHVIDAIDVLPTGAVSSEPASKLAPVSLSAEELAHPLSLAFDTLARTAGDALHVVAHAPSLGSSALAGFLAKATNGIPVPYDASSATYGAAGEYVTLVGPELRRLTVVGASANSNLRNAVLALGETPRDTPPTFRTLDVTVTSPTGHIVTVSSVTGASAYKAYDIEGTLLGTSSTPTIQVSGSPAALAITAEGSNGAVLATTQHRTNAYDTDSGREDVVVANSSSGRHVVRSLGSDSHPKLVVRTAIDVFQGGEPEREELAITCLRDFTDTAIDPAMQYSYEFITLSSSGSSCQPGSQQAVNSSFGTDGQLVAGVVFPPTTVPEAQSAEELGSTVVQFQNRLLAQREMSTVAATPSLVDAALMENSDAGTTPTTQSAWVPVQFQYQGWIPGREVFAPGGITGTLSRPFQYFGADGFSRNSRYDVHGSVRFRTNTRFVFGGSPSIHFTRSIGVTEKYACREFLGAWFGGDCVLQQTGRADASKDLTISDRRPGQRGGSAVVKVDSKNPLHAVAPAISGQIRYNLRAGGSSVTGSHDLMPIHEIWWGPDASEFYLAYQNTDIHPLCLAGGPWCTARVNVAI